MKIANIIVNLNHSELDRVFDYQIPKSLNADVGMEVEVPFGNQKINGYIVNITNKTEVDIKKLKPINKILHNGEVFLQKEQIELARIISNYYLYPLSSTLNTMIPGGLQGYSRTISIRKKKFVNLSSKADLTQIRSNAHKQMQVIEILKESNKINLNKLRKIADLKGNQVIYNLESKGILSITESEYMRKPLVRELSSSKSDYELNDDQKKVINIIDQYFDKKSFTQFLLHGVTGSGKTDIYIKAIKKCISQNKQAILLIPEIALTSQIVSRLLEHFKGKIAIMHSNLSAGERYDEWRRIQKGQVDVVVGARSAVFAPLSNLGLIIIDEEHEHTYKQESGLRYDAKRVAKWRAELNNSLLILGSATPSLTTFYKAKKGDINLLNMPNRVKQLPLPKFLIVDMKQEYKKGYKGLISNLLKDKINEQIYQNKSKVILLLNRRGFSYQFVCSGCGEVLKCPYCDIALTYHKDSNAFKCHYCNYHQKVNMHCSNCGSKIIPLGEGIQKAEEELTSLFPDVTIIRMDSDSTTKKNSHMHYLDEFKNTKKSILLGTQMIAKGLDIPEVNLVGIINADTALNLPDYTADERTFQLITQVSGRSGRGDMQGEVILQTYSPDNEIINLGCKQDFETFYNIEISHRKRMQYPPFANLIRIISMHEREKVAYRAIKFIETNLAKIDGNFKILGPSPAPISKVRNKYRWHIIIKIINSNESENYIKYKVSEISKELRRRGQSLDKPLSLIVDIDPQSIM
ncbi:MAG: primosomal protein N' [Clostridia bacterium]